MSLFTKLFPYVLLTIQKYGIDESHGLSHSMNVLMYTNKIYNAEKESFPVLKTQENILYASAVLHDMCDKKYMDEEKGVADIDVFLQHLLLKEEREAVTTIVSTMSYSKVKTEGFPELVDLQTCYHIVREADLLAAYDFDRCMIYNMYRKKGNIEEAFADARDIFISRVFKHNEDDLFVTNFAKRESIILQNLAVKRMLHWKRLLQIPSG